MFLIIRIQNIQCPFTLIFHRWICQKFLLEYFAQWNRYMKTWPIYLKWHFEQKNLNSVKLQESHEKFLQFYADLYYKNTWIVLILTVPFWLGENFLSVFYALSLIRKCCNFVKGKCVFNWNENYFCYGMSQEAISKIYSSHNSINIHWLRIYSCMAERKAIARYPVHNTNTEHHYTSEKRSCLYKRIVKLKIL